MVNNIKKLILKLTPDFIHKYYHILLAYIGSFFYGNPSKKMIVIGITGTKGKTSTANFIWSVLNNAGIKTGIISTANIRIGNSESLNHFHMTMPGRFAISRLMKNMLDTNCKVCVVEVTSEGIKQGRHLSINFDYAIFTNLSPEHLPSHNNSFEEYKKTKGKLFERVGESERKTIDDKKIEKIIIANSDSEHAEYFLSFKADKKITYGISSGDIQAENIGENKRGVDFTIREVPYRSQILGAFNIYNILPAIIIGKNMGISDEFLQKGVSNLSGIPGRMEIISNNKNLLVIVDYAHEGQSMKALLDSAIKIKESPESKIIVLFGAEGGGRDKAKRSVMGNLAGKLADYVIISNVEPYDDDPQEIIGDISQHVVSAGKKIDENLFLIEDRRAGIAKALSLAKSGDTVLITGKGSEQSMIIGDKKIIWDDRVVVREELEMLQ